MSRWQAPPKQATISPIVLLLLLLLLLLLAVCLTFKWQYSLLAHCERYLISSILVIILVRMQLTLKIVSSFFI